ncbi:MAG TPA: GNAT family N-acetyltransferase [Streptosporangiaceae bacterium]|nr:GNAT family N-acetyltransferase [Streptosporangiaceae bacterium]
MTGPDHRSVGLAGELLERAARATPATAEDRATGWWLRHTDSSMWWSGAVLAHGAQDRLCERIEAAEQFYAAHDAVTRFQICPDCPSGLDGLLAGRGYLSQPPVLLLTAAAGELAQAPGSPGLSMQIGRQLTANWVSVLSATSPGVAVDRDSRAIAGAGHPHAYFTVLADAHPVGIGRAVADGGWTGVFNMATTPMARRRGVARLVLTSIAQWAVARQAPRLYLQVERQNLPARRLYQASGFSELASYHYRVGEA